jgi:Protein of unknown function (DUF1194)
MKWFLCFLCFALPAQAQNCRLALVLALDVSSSVNESEYLLQSEGLARALEDEDVQNAILLGSGVVALTIFEWSGRREQAEVLDWRMVYTVQDLLLAAERIRKHGRAIPGSLTAIGNAADFAAGQLAKAPQCMRQVVDVSGDGVTNDGLPIQAAYQDPVFANVTVNGLVIGTDRKVRDHYEMAVLHGPGSFLVDAKDFDDFERAMKEKLIRETSVFQVSSR